MRCSAAVFLFLVVCGLARGNFSLKRPRCPPVRAPRRGTVSCSSGNGRVGCGAKPSPGSIASFRCRRHYRLEGQESARCLRDGTWTSVPPRCLPDCGKASPAVSLVVKGTLATPGAFPWHVAIYNFSDGEYEYWCGASLISEYAVITAAHCVWNIPPENLILAFGKFERDFHSDEVNVQKIKAKRIEKLESYQDAAGNYNGDVCVITVETPVHLDHLSAPICLDWNQKLADRHLVEGTLGLALGWGLTENDTFSDHLRMVWLPVTSDKKCIAEQARDFKKFVTYTSFCAGFGNGTGVCNGDSGGGLAFFDEDDGRWYLQGVVSISPRRPGTPYCDSRFYTVFTKVNAFSKWLAGLGVLEEEESENVAGLPEAKGPRDPYAFVRKRFGDLMRGTEGNQLLLPHTKGILASGGIPRISHPRVFPERAKPPAVPLPFRSYPAPEGSPSPLDLSRFN